MIKETDGAPFPNFSASVDDLLGTLRIEMFIDDLLHSSRTRLDAEKDAAAPAPRHQLKKGLVDAVCPRAAGPCEPLA